MWKLEQAENPSFLSTPLSTGSAQELRGLPTKLSIPRNPHFSRVSALIHILTAPTAATADYLIILFIYYTLHHRKEVIHIMKLFCSKAELQKSVNIVMKAVPAKTTMPILECILIDASTNDIKFTSNDMELGIETRVQGMVLEKGIIALDAKIFSEIVRKLPDSDVTIETDERLNTTITCEKAKFNIPGKSGEDFAYLPLIEKNECIRVSQFTLKEIIRQTIFSIA